MVAGLVVLALIVVVVVVVVTRGPGHSGAATPPTTDNPSAAALRFQAASVFHLERNADDAANVGFAIDGNIQTAWQTDIYFTRQFGNLRRGLGLALTLNATQALHHLIVMSATSGWSAEVYIADSVPDPASLAPWGQPVDTLQNIQGNTIFNLHGHQGRAVLLWITDLGPSLRVSVAEATAN